jgi:hypothetical protein
MLLRPYASFLVSEYVFLGFATLVVDGIRECA